MAQLTITCEECGHRHETSRANTKLCGVCALVRDLKFLADHTEECWLCKEEFAPIGRGEHACGACSYHVKGHGLTDCSYCGKHSRRVRPEVSVCNVCARNPELRRKFLLALIRKQQQRQEVPA